MATLVPRAPILVLASASPARRRTLVAAGLDPAVIVSAVDEDDLVARYRVTAPADIALLLARAKAEDVAGRDDVPDGALVLGCDSVLDLDGAPLGKPGDPRTAGERWRMMRGRSGTLVTGHWLIDTREGGSAATIGAVAATTVRFAALSDAEIDAYVATGEPMAVAGGFTVDGLGGPFIAGIEGDYHNVVGVSLPLLRELAAECGVSWPELWAAAG